MLQLSGEPNSSASHQLIEQLQSEKTDLESKLEQVRYMYSYMLVLVPN